MAVLQNRRPPRIHPGCTDPLLKEGSVPSRCTLGFIVFHQFFFYEKRLELKSLKGQTKAEELGDPTPDLLSLHLSLNSNAL